jgi:Putative beta-barrel porin-2, OmpL-like. bbp2
MKKVSLTQAIWRLVNAGALLTAVGITSLTGPDAQADGFGRRSAASRTAASRLAVDDDEDDILQVLEEEMAPAPGVAPPEEAPPQFMANEKEVAPEEPPAPWTLTELFNNSDGSNPFKDSGVKISGHTQFGYVSDPDGAFTGNGNTLNAQQWGFFGLHQQYLYAEKVADGSKGWGWGFRTDGLYGLQGFDGQAFGNTNSGHWDYLNGFDHGAYNFAVPQAYGELAYDKFSVKMGHFYTIVGYEVVPSTQQFFVTRQLTFWNSEPFTHTGALGTYKASDKFSLLGGWVAGMDTGFYQFNGGSSFLGGFNWMIDDKTTMTYGMIWGNLGWRGNGAINSIILSRQWTPKFSTVTQFDDLATDLTQLNPASPPNAQTFTNIPQNFNVQGGVAQQSIGLIQYAFYDITPKVKGGVRGEWYRPDAVNYYTLSFGANYKPVQNLIIRPEVRQMWSENHQIYTGANNFSGNIYNQTVWAIDMILTY